MRTVVRSAAGRRAGFTLVEVLIAAALCLLIMTVMATAFQAGLDTLSQLKSLGDLQTRLRTAEVVLRRDLQSDHLESASGRNRVSDQRLDRWVPPGQPLPPGTQPEPPAWEPPILGFFRIYQEPAYDAAQRALNRVTQIEGSDADGLPTSRSTGHVLHMAVRLPADRTDKIFDADLSSGVAGGLVPPLQTFGLSRLQNASLFRSQWAEVAYFLDTSNPTAATAPDGSGRTLYTYPLVRRSRLLTEPRAPGVPRPPIDWQSVVTGNTPARGQGMSMSPEPVFAPNPMGGNPFFFGNNGATMPTNAPAYLLNDPADVTNPSNRLGGLGGIIGTMTGQPAGGSPFVSNRYNVGYQPPAAFFAPNGNNGAVPHVARPTALTAAHTLAAERTAMTAPTAAGTSGPTAGGDVLMLNVLSFEVRVSYDLNPNVDLRYNAMVDAMGNPISPQTGFAQLGQMVNFNPQTNPANVCRIPLGSPLMTAGHSGTADGEFDDLPPSPFAIGAGLSTVPAGNPPNGLGNPLYHRFGDPVGSKPRVFDLWGTNLLPVAPSNFNVNGGMGPNVPARAQWHEPVGFTLDATGNPVGPAANPNFVPLPIRVKAIQIKLRAYDPKNKVSRQITIVESL